MPDSMQYQQCRQLKDEAKQRADEQKYVEAAQLYKQAYDLCHDGFAASKYLYCSRKSSVAAAREAAKFARQVAPLFPDDIYITREYVWTIYDGYLKNIGSDEGVEDENVDDLGHESFELPTHDFKVTVDAARRIFELTSEPLPCKLATFAICKEAKRLKKWELVREFALRLDPQTLLMEQKEIDGRKIPSEYQKWLFAVTRAFLELGDYDQCLNYAHTAIEKFPNESLHFHRWEALAKIRVGHVEGGLQQLEHINTRFPKQWYVQSDIANAYMRLDQYEEAWLWFCKAASAPGDIKGRIGMFVTMVDILQRLEQWQTLYHHLLLVWAIEIEQGSKQRAERSRQRISEFERQHADLLSSMTGNKTDAAPSLSFALRPCRASWQKAVNASRPIQTGHISFVDEEKRYGFVTNDKGRFHFRFNALLRGKPEMNAQVEFEVEESYDKKRDQQSFSAINIRLARIQAPITLHNT